MKYNVIFSILLVLIILIGITGVDITEYFINDNSNDEITIPHDSIKSNAVYIASPNEISFDPMEIIETGDTSTYYAENNDENIEYGKVVCEAIIKALSGYCEKAEYRTSISSSITDSIHLSDNGYYYLEGYKYLNDQNDIRCLDCIISTGDYKIVYINFYEDTEYALKSEDINEGLNKFREYSEKFYTDLENAEESILPIIEKFSETFTDLDYIDAYSLYEKYQEIYQFTDTDYYIDNQSNPIEYFWMYSILLSTVYFRDYSEVYYYENAAGEYDQGQEFYEINVFGVQYIMECISTYLYNNGDSFITNDAEYIAYNGRIYQTIKLDKSFYFTDTIIVIYNINENIIEGFFASPNQTTS